MQYDPAHPRARAPPGDEMEGQPAAPPAGQRDMAGPRAMCVDPQSGSGWAASRPNTARDMAAWAATIPSRMPLQSPGCHPRPEHSGRSPPNCPATSFTEAPPSGAVPGCRHQRAHLFAWDARPAETALETGGDPRRDRIIALPGRETLRDHRQTVLVLPIRSAERETDYVLPSEISGSANNRCLGPDGNIYGITWMVLFRWRPETGKIEELYRCMGDDAKKPFGGSLFDRGAIIIGTRIYFSCGAHVMSLRLPRGGEKQ